MKHQKRLNKQGLILIFFVFFSLVTASGQNCDKWIFGYVPTYTQHSINGSIDYLEASDYDKLTHIGHLGPYVNIDGSFNMNSNGASNIRLERGVIDAHDNDVPILLSFQAWYTDYIPALSNVQSRASLINNVLYLLDLYQYDGVDVDLEPIMSPWVDGIQNGNDDYIAFINTLYDSLQMRICPFTGQKPLLAVAANGYAAPVLNQLQDKFDMINLLTYDLAGPYPGWVPWHDASVYDGGQTLPSTGQPMPSVHGEINHCISQGVNPSKLGVGLSMDAFRWRGGSGTSTGGVTAPMQNYVTDPTWTRFSYSNFITDHFNPIYYEFDADALMSYLSIDNVGNENDEFWSYNDQYSCIAKVDYVWDNNLGGTMIWELKSGYLPSNPIHNRIPQLNYTYDQNCLRAAVLPLTYINSPNCNYYKNANYLEWTTAVEVNIDAFEISGFDQISDSWQFLKEIPAKGKPASYSIDVKNELTSNIKSYKICSRDLDGLVSSCHFCDCFITDEKYKIYPNPSNAILNVEYGSDDEGLITIIDQSGKIKYKGLIAPIVDISFLNDGVYLLKITGNRRTENFKIIKLNE